MSDNQEMPAPINFTDNAVKKVAELIAEEGNHLPVPHHMIMA